MNKTLLVALLLASTHSIAKKPTYVGLGRYVCGSCNTVQTVSPAYAHDYYAEGSESSQSIRDFLETDRYVREVEMMTRPHVEPYHNVPKKPQSAHDIEVDNWTPEQAAAWVKGYCGPNNENKDKVNTPEICK